MERATGAQARTTSTSETRAAAGSSHAPEELLTGSAAEIAARLARLPATVVEAAMARLQADHGNALASDVVARLGDANGVTPRCEEAAADAMADRAVARIDAAPVEGSDFDAHRARFAAALDADLTGVTARASAAPAQVGAVAFAQGNDLQFQPGAWRPGTPDGDHLIAHELAHALQGGSELRPKLVVAERTWMHDDRELFLERLAKKYPSGKHDPPESKAYKQQRTPGEPMREAIHGMGRSDEVFAFDGVVELERMLVMRQQSIENLDNPASCAYPDEEHKPRLNPSHWKEGKGRYEWRVRSGVKPSTAIRGIWDGEDGEWRLECYTMTVASEYKAQLDAIGAERFDAKHAKGLVLSTDPSLSGTKVLEDAGVIEIAKVASEDDLLPGDWVYFKNHPDYLKKHPDGMWQGENTLCVGLVGGAMHYRGFGIDDMSSAALKRELADAFNEEADDGVGAKYRDKQIQPKDVPGPVLDHVRRPARTAIEDPE